jgi:hypothetical protein
MSIIAAIFAGIHLCYAAGTLGDINHHQYYRENYYGNTKVSKVGNLCCLL